MTIVNDATGRETSRTDQDGETTTTSYDAVTGLANCIVTPDGKQTWFSYDFRGRLVQQYGTAVQPIKWEYDAMDRIVALHEALFWMRFHPRIPISHAGLMTL